MDKLKLDLQRFALDPPMAGNIIDEVCLHRYHQNIKRDYAKKSSDNNFANLVVDSIRTKNMFNINEARNGAIATNSTAETLDYNTDSLTTGWIPCKPNTQYTISGGYNRSRWQTKASNGTITYGGENQTTITTNATAQYLRFYYYYGSGAVTPSAVPNFQIEEGNTATTYTAFQDLNPDTSGFDNGYMPNFGGFNKRTVRGNQTSYSYVVPNHQPNGFIRNALVMCGDKGFMAIRWSGNNSINPTVAWSSFNSSQVSSITQNNGILTITFASTVYGSFDVLFTN